MLEIWGGPSLSLNARLRPFGWERESVSVGCSLPSQVTANYLELRLRDDRAIYEYEVGFDPAVDAREERFRIVGQLSDVVGNTRVRRMRSEQGRKGAKPKCATRQVGRAP